jgi:hypothetical protein
VKRIEAAELRRRSALRRWRGAQEEKRGGEARGVEEVLLPFYRAEGEGETAR